MNDIDIFIKTIPPDLREGVQKLREQLLKHDLEESEKYGIPFYSYQGQLCYINPGKKLVLGFVKGALMDDPEGLLTGDQKQVRHIVMDYDNVVDVGWYIENAKSLN